MTKAANRTVTPAQIAVLDAVWKIYGHQMPADPACYRRIANALPTGTTGGVVDKLRVLRHKGYIESLGDSRQRPEAWVIKGGALSQARKLVRVNRSAP